MVVESRLFLQRTLVLFVFLISGFATAQPSELLKPSEELIFGFTTEKGKHLLLAREKENQYIVYRFGTKNKVEFEYPKQHKGSWEVMTSSHYMRGGTDSLNMELMYVYFNSGNYQYVIYQNLMPDGRKNIGVRVYDLKSPTKKAEIAGRIDSQQGDLGNIISSDLIAHSDATFD